MRWRALALTAALATTGCDSELELYRPELDDERGVIEMRTSQDAYCRGATVGPTTRISYDNLPPMALTGGRHHETPITRWYPSPIAPVTVRFGVACMDEDHEISEAKEAFWYLR